MTQFRLYCSTSHGRIAQLLQLGTVMVGCGSGACFYGNQPVMWDLVELPRASAYLETGELRVRLR